MVHQRGHEYAGDHGEMLGVQSGRGSLNCTGTVREAMSTLMGTERWWSFFDGLFFDSDRNASGPRPSGVPDLWTPFLTNGRQGCSPTINTDRLLTDQ